MGGYSSNTGQLHFLGEYKGRTGLSGMPWTLVILYGGEVMLTVLKVFDNQLGLYSGRTVWQGQSNRETTISATNHIGHNVSATNDIAATAFYICSYVQQRYMVHNDGISLTEDDRWIPEDDDFAGDKE